MLVSPLTTEELKNLAPKVKAMGFDWFELPLEVIGDLDPVEGAAILRDHDLGVSVCAAAITSSSVASRRP